MHIKPAATVGLAVTLEAYYLWINQNIGPALWLLLAIIGVNFLASLYLRKGLRDIPHSLANYGLSIGGSVLATSNFSISINFVKTIIILLLFHEISVTAPIFLAALKKLGVSDTVAQEIEAEGEQLIEKKVPVHADPAQENN